MLKLTNNHTLYEVWCSHFAESVYIDHKPTKNEIEEIRKNRWLGIDDSGLLFEIEVFKLRPFYTGAAVANRKLKLRRYQCNFCVGTGSHMVIECPKCGGRGYFE
jgi:hypothetical protein